MAGDWIKMRTNLWDDPRITRICDLTQNFEASVIGGLFWLWATADEHTENGILTGMSTATIDRKTGIKGFGEALIDIGWIAEHASGIRIIRFDEHNGKSAKNRLQTAKRVAKHASKKSGVSGALAKSANANADTVSEALPRGGVSEALPRIRIRIREEVNPKSKAPSQGEVINPLTEDSGANSAGEKIDPITGEVIRLHHLAGRVSA